MKTITIEVPDQPPSEIAASGEGPTREFRPAAGLHRHDRGLIPPGDGAEIAEPTRFEFIDAPSAARVDALQAI